MLQRRKISGQSRKGNAIDITFAEDIWSEVIGGNATDTMFVEGIRGEGVVGEYEGRPLSRLWTHHRRPESGAGDSKQPARTKPKGFALAALCEG